MASIPSEHTTREALQRWLLEFHATSETLNARDFSMHFTGDAELQYANSPVVRGRDAIQQNFAQAFERLDVMTHDIVYFDLVPGAIPRLYQAADIKYVVKGDDPVDNMINIPGFLSGVLAWDDGALRFKRCEIYLDASKVFGRMAEKGLFL